MSEAVFPNSELRWTPHDGIDVDDSCITVELIGHKPKRYWAKEVGRDSTGVARYKLLPMDRG